MLLVHEACFSIQLCWNNGTVPLTSCELPYAVKHACRVYIATKLYSACALWQCIVPAVCSKASLKCIVVFPQADSIR